MEKRGRKWTALTIRSFFLLAGSSYAYEKQQRHRNLSCFLMAQIYHRFSSFFVLHTIKTWVGGDPHCGNNSYCSNDLYCCLGWHVPPQSASWSDSDCPVCHKQGLFGCLCHSIRVGLILEASSRCVCIDYSRCHLLCRLA